MIVGIREPWRQPEEFRKASEAHDSMSEADMAEALRNARRAGSIDGECVDITDQAALPPPGER